MATHTLKERFNNFSDKLIRIALRALEDGNDSNGLEMQVDRLSTLLTMYHRVRQYYNENEFNLKLEEINYIKGRIQYQLQFLNNNDLSFAKKTFVSKIPTGGRPKTVVDIEAVKPLREQEFSWSKIAEIFDISLSTLRNIRTEYNIEDSIQPYTNISNDELDSLTSQISMITPFMEKLCLQVH